MSSVWNYMNQGLAGLSPAARQALLTTGLGLTIPRVGLGEAGLKGLDTYQKLTEQATQSALENRRTAAVESEAELRKQEAALRAQEYAQKTSEYEQGQTERKALIDTYGTVDWKALGYPDEIAKLAKADPLVARQLLESRYPKDASAAARDARIGETKPIHFEGDKPGYVRDAQWNGKAWVPVQNASPYLPKGEFDFGDPNAASGRADDIFAAGTGANLPSVAPSGNVVTPPPAPVGPPATMPSAGLGQTPAPAAMQFGNPPPMPTLPPASQQFMPPPQQPAPAPYNPNQDAFQGGRQALDLGSRALDALKYKRWITNPTSRAQLGLPPLDQIPPG